MIRLLVLSLAVLLSTTPTVSAKSPPAVPAIAVEQVELPPLVFRSHAIAVRGKPRYDRDFKSFDYVNPDAPKGGELRLGVAGRFDSLNPFIVAGTAGVGTAAAVEQLMVRNREEEPFTAYGLIAETVEWPEDRSWIAFELRPEARWHDGRPITVEDVIFSMQLLKSLGDPRYSRLYRAVRGAQRAGDRKVRFDLAVDIDPELPLAIAEMPVLPKHYWAGRDFARPAPEPPLGSGPYRVARFEAGRFVELERVADYWGKDLPVNVGHHNFERVRYTYFSTLAELREALMDGRIDLTFETSLKAWSGSYHGSAQHAGWLKREEIPHGRPVGFRGFVFNSRRTPFDDRRVRRALTLAFDFEWTRKTLLFGATSRTTSYFENSELAAEGRPSDRELEILEPFRDRVPAQVFSTAYELPATDGSGWSRAHRREALDLLSQAGWEVRDMHLVERATGRPLQFEILLADRALLAITRAYVQNLARLGIEASVHVSDPKRYAARAADFDFDMTTMTLPQSAAPGGELRDYWSSSAAGQAGSRNLAGVADPAVDALIELVLAARDRQSLIDRARALDRVLLWGHYAIPHNHSKVSRLVTWDKFGRPAPTRTGTGPGYWWFDKAKADALERARGNGWPAR